MLCLKFQRNNQYPPIMEPTSGKIGEKVYIFSILIKLKAVFNFTVDDFFNENQ